MSHKPRVVGHRGWPARYPDNTLAGFLAAATVSDAVETDVRRCGDGKLALSHDPVIDGMEVARTTWSQLAEVDLGQGHHPTLLDELVASLPDTPMQLEIKNLPFEPGFEPDHRVALETAERARAADIVTSFFWPSVDAVRRSFPDVATGLCLTKGTDLRAALDHCLEVGHRALVPSIDFPPSDMEEALQRGIEVYPWVVNDNEMLDELAGIGVSGIITDDPKKMMTTMRRGL
ncbi:MAG: glycerophosphodiester phosphodiesterase [Acidimicrobiia bacterium]